MIQEHKDLVLKDLSARLPYGVKGRVSRRDHNNRECEFVAIIDGKLYDKFAVAQESWYDNVTIKPFLFPLSSMTEEQRLEYYGTFSLSGDISDSIDFYNKYHLDWRGLIPLGLAEDATGKNIY